MHRLNYVFSLIVLAGCATADKGTELVGADGKEDSFASPTDHGPILDWAAQKHAEITRSSMFHQWEFYLSGPATVTVRTQGQNASDAEVDTVMYLYRRNTQGTWGRYIAKNDDYRGSVWSRIKYASSLPSGEYAVRVKPYSRTDLGAFALSTVCEGAGCTRPSVSDSICDTLVDYASELCLPGDDSDAMFESCFEEVSYGEVMGDYRTVARDCCRGGENLWCEQMPPATLTKVEIPADVLQAVEANYEIGRDTWDSGGISAIRRYRVTNGDPNRLADLVAAVIVEQQAYAEANRPDGSFDEYCAQSAEDEPAIWSTNRIECAVAISERNVGHHFLGNFVWDQADDEATRFRNAVKTIEDYVRDMVGTQYVEVYSNTNIWSVDVLTSVLIRSDFSEIIVASYDYGA